MRDCPMILVPAYGRKYETVQDAVNDYLAGRDFKILGGPYCSCRDFPGESVSIRWTWHRAPSSYEVVVTPTSNKG